MVQCKGLSQQRGHATGLQKGVEWWGHVGPSATLLCHKDALGRLDDDIALLPSRTQGSILSTLACVLQGLTGNADVLDLSKLTFQHLAKLQEPSVSFDLASLSQKCLLNTTRNLRHRELVEQLALSVVSPKAARGHYRWFHRRMPGGKK